MGEVSEHDTQRLKREWDGWNPEVLESMWKDMMGGWNRMRKGVVSTVDRSTVQTNVQMDNRAGKECGRLKRRQVVSVKG